MRRQSNTTRQHTMCIVSIVVSDAEKEDSYTKFMTRHDNSSVICRKAILYIIHSNAKCILYLYISRIV